MTNQSKSDLPAKLARGCERFEKWRSGRKPYSRLPEPLWSAAVKLAQEYGITLTARVLRLDHNGLKKRMELSVSDVGPQAVPDFIELLGSELTTAAECAIECKDTHGATIRIHLKGSQLPDVEALLHSFRKFGQ